MIVVFLHVAVDGRSYFIFFPESEARKKNWTDFPFLDMKMMLLLDLSFFPRLFGHAKTRWICQTRTINQTNLMSNIIGLPSFFFSPVSPISFSSLKISSCFFSNKPPRRPTPHTYRVFKRKTWCFEHLLGHQNCTFKS